MPGTGVGERQPWEVAKRDDAGPVLELVSKPKFPPHAAGAGFPDPQHQAGDGDHQRWWGHLNLRIFDYGHATRDCGGGRHQWCVGSCELVRHWRDVTSVRGSDSALWANSGGISPYCFTKISANSRSPAGRRWMPSK